MPSFVIRPASITDVELIVKVRVVALTEEEVSGFVVPGDSFYSSVDKLEQVWDRDNRLKDGFEVFIQLF